MNWFPWLLWLHIFGAIVAFGPTFAFPIIGRMGGKEPMHANFATRVTHRIAEGITLPLAFVQGITGVGLLLATDRLSHLFEQTNYWLVLGITLYVLALMVAIFVQNPRTVRLIELTSTPPPPPAPGTAPSGPPPAIMAAVRSVQQGGIVMTVLLVSIIFLMVVKPLH